MKIITRTILPGSNALPGVIRLAAFLIFTVLISLTACAPQNNMFEGPTPIPTLIPVTISPRDLNPTEVSVQVIESYPAGMPSALTGQSLYNDHCASCHGVDGNGLVPNARNFGDVDYMRGETPADFYVIITEGSGPEMPSFGEELTSDERWAVVYYVWRFSTTSEILNTGHEIYVEDCESCHGEDGRSLILGAANFSDHRFMANQSPSELYVSVTQGQGSMPAWQARLAQDERWAVINFIRTFSYDPQVDSQEIVEVVATTGNEREERAECAPYMDRDNPFDWDSPETIAAGLNLYNTNCSSCHGEDGTGRLPGILDFSNPSIQSELRSNPNIYLCSIAEGYQAMPQYKTKLSEEEMWQLLVTISSFAN